MEVVGTMWHIAATARQPSASDATPEMFFCEAVVSRFAAVRHARHPGKQRTPESSPARHQAHECLTLVKLFDYFVMVQGA